MKYTIEIELTDTDYGVAHAELHLTTPDDAIGRLVTVTASGTHHDVSENGQSVHRAGYVNASRALGAGLARLTDDVERAWARYARIHGTGAR